MTTVAIHQPEYWPHLSWLAKLVRADVFVLLDTAQFDRDSLQQRTKLRTPREMIYLTVPYKHVGHPQQLADVEIAGDQWRRAHWLTLLHTFAHTAGFLEHRRALESFYAEQEPRLLPVTAGSAILLASRVAPEREITLASMLRNVSGAKGELVLNICKALNATTYLSGMSGARYLSSTAFAETGIEIRLSRQNFPPYRQRWGTFEPNISGLDLLCNLGTDGARSYLEALR